MLTNNHTQGFMERFKNILLRSFIAINVVVIVAIYYLSEIRPFPYEGYEKDINLLQRYDAQLNEAIVTTQFGILKYYDSLWQALDGSHQVIEDFKKRLTSHPNNEIEGKLNTLEKSIDRKEELTERFARINPILINAIYHFSTILGEIIDSESNIQLVEGCSVQDYRPILLDKTNNLFRGILVYINFRSDEKRDDLLQLVQEIRSAPAKQKFAKLDLALTYADKILELQPQLTQINEELFQVPIVANLNALNNSYNKSFHHFLDSADAYQIVLYFLVFLLLVALRWAFARLQGTVNTLHIEVQRKIKAEKELEEINRQLEQRVTERTRELMIKNNDLNQALANLKEAQDQLIMQEKMASVGMLTTGIAHEIKNPLNFVNNFSDISVELVGELTDVLEANKQAISSESMTTVTEILQDLKTNSLKIKEHGERADNIVKNMLLHSQEAGIEKEMFDVKALLEDNLQIALENFRSTQGKFEIKVEKDFDPNVSKVIAAPQSIARVFVYLIDNALYALKEKQQLNLPDYQPTLTVSIQKENETAIVIKVKDNGTGISKKAIDRVFEPFFTTKPTGKGNTGLGLSICYDTVVKQHKGELRVTSEEGVYTEFTVILPAATKIKG